MVSVAIFDMDGVIFQGRNFWMDLHRAYGTLHEGLGFTNRYLDTNYEKLVKLVVGGLWRGKPAYIYEELVRGREYEPHVVETFERMDSSIRTAIITSGPRDLARRAQEELGIDFIFANNLHVRGDTLSGDFEWPVGNDKKAKTAMSLIQELGIKTSDVGFVGDSENDVQLASLVGFPIAYNSNSHLLNEKCRWVLSRGEFGKILNILR